MIKNTSWPTNKEAHAHMRRMQALNKSSCMKSSAEHWLADKLSETGRKWTRQAQWGFRLFDFWNKDLGIAVECDGPEHSPESDNNADDRDFKRSAIVVLRVRNFNDDDAYTALLLIASSGPWNERRKRMGLQPIKNSKG